ncbi:MAG: hypothetical protein KYX68_12180 [Flavobacterium sp.]|nr:hypothetical protein [Flavobacterium sp.]
MKKYYVNKIAQSNGDHEVHSENCTFLPKIENRIYLGEFNSCRLAVTKAKEYYYKTNGCFFCSKECHTT